MNALLLAMFLTAATDLKEIQKAKQLKILVHGGADFLPRNGDPKIAEEQLAREFAQKLGLEPVIIPVAEQSQLIDELIAGRGDLIASSLAVTVERSARIAFTRPVRFVAQMLVVPVAEKGLNKPEDLAGKVVTVRPSSSYAATLKALQAKVPTLQVKPAPETVDTFALIQKVARGEERFTVADSDILEAALGFEPGVKGAFKLTEKDPIAWGVRKDSPELKAALDSFLVEHALSSFKDQAYKADLDEIKKRGVLRVLTRNTSTTFFVYKGDQFGFDFELARELAKSLGVRLEISIPPTREALLQYLAEGKGDFVAAGLTITPERQKSFAFSSPYQTVSEVVVVAAKDKAQSLADLKGRKITVRKSSSYYESLKALEATQGFEIDLAAEDIETEELLDQVGEGKLAATVADSNIVEVELTYSDRIRALGPLGDLKSIGWAMRPDQPKLKAATDAFVKKNYKGLFYNMTVNKYFKNPKYMKAAAADQRSDKAGAISPYDALIKKYAKQYEFDWRLIAAQMFQESRFDPNAKSWVGAQGLMQVMPQTAKELKFDDVIDPEKGVHAGVKLLARYSAMFSEPDVKEKDRIRFAIASYNCGPGHVIDARRIAIDMKLNPDKWFGNVEKALAQLAKPEVARKARHGFCRCDEPVKYVSEIQTRYDAYSKIAPAE